MKKSVICLVNYKVIHAKDMGMVYKSRIVATALFLAAFTVAYFISPVAYADNTNSVDFERSSSQSLSISDAGQTGLDGSTNMTIEAWVKFESLPTGEDNASIVDKYVSAGNQRSYTFDWNGGNLRFITTSDGVTGSGGSIGVSWSPSTGTWYHVAVSKTGASATFYVNGVQQGSPQSSTNDIHNGTAPFSIGRIGNGDQFFDGLIDDVRVWNVARTQGEIAANIDQELAGNETGLAGYWKFNGESLEDTTANNNDLTNINGAAFSMDTPFTGAPPAPDPVIVIPGILGSMEHNGVWEMDPILHTYDDLLATLDANGYTPDVDLFPFPYDWRASNVDTAALLKQKIDAVKVVCACDTVDLVAHSMGGLVARQYMQSALYEDDVDQLVFLGTPHQGAPNAYLMWEGGTTGFDWMDKLFSLVLRHEAKEKGYTDAVSYAQGEPVSSVQQLLPIYDYLLDDSVVRPYPTEYPVNTFLENLHASLGDLLASGASLYNFVGETAGATTVSGINVVASDDAPPTWEHGEPAADPFMLGSGDGTVPTASASVIPSNLTTLPARHRALPSAAKGEVVEILSGETSPTLVDTIDIPNLKLLVIQIFSPADLLVIAPDGTKIGREGGAEVNEIPLAFYTGFSTDVEFITIPNPQDGVYMVVSNGTAAGPYTVEAHFLSDATTTSASYSGETAPGALTELELDVDNAHPENFMITGPDIEPPTITITSPVAQDYPRSLQLPVTVTAEDISGVESIETKLDGITIPSTGAIDLFFHPLGDHTFSAEAQDTTGNTATSSVAFRVIATASSTVADLDRAYALGWMTKKIHDELAKKMKALVISKKAAETVIGKKLKKGSEAAEEAIDKALAKALLKELDKYRGKGLDERAYQLLREDILWLVSQ